MNRVEKNLAEAFDESIAQIYVARFRKLQEEIRTEIFGRYQNIYIQDLRPPKTGEIDNGESTARRREPGKDS